MKRVGAIYPYNHIKNTKDTKFGVIAFPDILQRNS